MKICYINPTFLLRRPIAELVGLLKHETAIFIPKKPFKKLEGKWHNDDVLNKTKVYTYSAINIPFVNFEWPIPITPMFFINLFRVFKNHQVIHMWTYFYINSFFTLFLALFFPKRKLIMSCDTFPGYSFSSGKFIDVLFRTYTKLFGWFLFSVPNKIHLYGKGLVEYANKIGIKEKKIVVLSTGINLSKFRNAENIRQELNLTDKNFVIIFAGIISERKGIDIMLETIRTLNDTNIKLLLVGDGPEKKKYIKISEELGISNQVLFLGWRKDIPSLLKSSDVLFLPSRGEGLPGIVMEAMASGLPIVASNIPCIPDLVQDEVNGFLCDIDYMSCTWALNAIIKNNNLRKEMGIKSLERIKSFDWSNLINKYENLYMEEN